jgi:hypothetical protein
MNVVAGLIWQKDWYFTCAGPDLAFGEQQRSANALPG